MSKEKKYLISGLIALVVVVGGLFLLQTKSQNQPGQYDAVAKCIADSGTKFYGAFWCPHCHAEKERFGSSAQYLPYVECSNPDGASQNDKCNSLGISSYPTWVFPDHSTSTGELEIAELAAKTGCSITGGTTSGAATTTTSGGSSSAVPTATSTGTSEDGTVQVHI